MLSGQNYGFSWGRCSISGYWNILQDCSGNFLSRIRSGKISLNFLGSSIWFGKICLCPYTTHLLFHLDITLKVQNSYITQFIASDSITFYFISSLKEQWKHNWEPMQWIMDIVKYIWDWKLLKSRFLGDTDYVISDEYINHWELSI